MSECPKSSTQVMFSIFKSLATFWGHYCSDTVKHCLERDSPCFPAPWFLPPQYPGMENFALNLVPVGRHLLLCADMTDHYSENEIVRIYPFQELMSERLLSLCYMRILSSASWEGRCHLDVIYLQRKRKRKFLCHPLDSAISLSTN